MEEIKNSKRAKMSGDGGGDSGQEVHPLLINLVLEKVFPYCKDSPSDNWLTLSDLRLVCKVWDKELTKLIRQDTEMNILRLISPYPDGFGWTPDEEDGGEGYHYTCPYPVTSPFENIAVHGLCNVLPVAKNLADWFRVMGPEVKSLRYPSALTCYHQTRFLECVLKLWCPNLKTLTLTGVECLQTLLHNSKFVDVTSKLICADLEQVTLSLQEEDEADPLRPFKNCQPEEILTGSYLNFAKGASRKLVPDDPAHRTFGLKMLKRVTRDFSAPVPQDTLDFIRNTTVNDGGVLGQIFGSCSSTIDNLIVNNMSVLQCQEFLPFLNFRPLRIKNTLKTFEFDNFPLALNSIHMDAFRLLKFPLTSIKFGLLFAFEIVDSLRNLIVAVNNNITLIASYSESLEHLEFSGNVVLQDWATEQEEEFLEVVLPQLPKLKRFVNGNIFTCRMGGLDFLKKMPRLESCSLTNTIYHSSIYPLTPAEVFNMLFQAAYLENTHPLQELMLDGKICYNNHVDMLQNWFPGLRKVDLILDGADVFVDFLRVAKNLKVEEVKVAFYANDNEWCNAGIVNNVGKMTNLKFLQLNHLTDSPLTISAKTCEEGFARAPQLTSLQLTNFGMFADEVLKIKACLSYISCVKFHRAVLQYKPVDVDFSVGVDKSFPFAGL